MTESHPNQRADAPAEHRLLPLLLVLFIGSGCAALIYEIVWFQLLQLVIGSSAVSLGVLLGTFMGGMCLGSLVLPRVISVRQHPLRVYAMLELGIGILGILVLYGMPCMAQLYISLVGHGFPGIILRGAICAICLLPPTLLMGATLPAIARRLDSTPQGVGWLGFFYGGNIAGAVFGCLLAGFYLLRHYDMVVATCVAASLNITLALLGLGLAMLMPHHAPATEPHPLPGANGSGYWPVYVTIALSGLCALGAEVIWTRLLSLMLGATVYTFSIILAVFLVGLGLGSSVGSFLSRQTLRPRASLGGCQLLLTAAIVWAAYQLAHSLPYWPINPSLTSNPWFLFQLDILRCLWAILPAAFLWGASFPLALAAAAAPGQDPGRLVGGVYAANTAGAILGSLGFSIFLIPWIGTQQSQRVLAGLATVAAFFMFVPLAWSFWSAIPVNRPVKRWGVILAGAGLLVCVAGLATGFVRSVAGLPWELVAYGRYLPTWLGNAEVVFMGEGMNSSVAVSELFDGTRNFHVSGKVEASNNPNDMRLQRMLGHLPALLHPQARSVLVVGCGAGVTAGSFLTHSNIEKIVICEIEPLIPQSVAPYFEVENYDVVRSPRVSMVYDDARHYILTTTNQFDIITSDPIHPWVKGAATLYTREYFELCKRRLKAGGIISQWIPLYESKAEVVKSELATFFEVFPLGTIWGNDVQGKGYDVVLLGQANATSINLDEIQRWMDRKDHMSLTLSLDEVGFKSAVDLFATYAGRGADLRPWLKQAEINRDVNLRLQYLAGLGLDLNQSERIYADMLAYRQVPEGLFIASDQKKLALKKALEAVSGR